MPTTNDWLRMIYNSLAGGGNSGETPIGLGEAEVRNAIETASNLDEVEALLGLIHGSQLSVAQVTNAIEAASNLYEIQTSLTAINEAQVSEAQLRNAIQTATNLDQIETLLAAINGAQLSVAQVASAIQGATNIDGLEALLTSIYSDRLTQAQVTSAIQSATNLDQIETLLTALNVAQLTAAQVTGAIEAATNLDQIESLLTTIAANQSKDFATKPLLISSTPTGSGATRTWTVPLDKEWLVQSVYFRLTTSSTAITRMPIVRLDQGGNSPVIVPACVSQAASTIRGYAFMVGFGAAYNPATDYAAQPLPALPLRRVSGNTGSVNIYVQNFQSGDVLDFMNISYYERDVVT